MGKRNLKNKYRNRKNKNEYDIEKIDEEYKLEDSFKIDEVYIIIQKVS
jgi:hypothetical protein